MSGFVYAIACGDLVKIGYSAKPLVRLVKIRSDNPIGAILLGVVPATMEQEQELHELLNEWRERGEWFRRGSRAVEAFIAALRPMPLPAQPIWLEPAATIIRKLGGPSKVAAITGVHPTRVYGWKRAGGRIPQWHYNALLRAARELGVDSITPASFLPLEDGAVA